MRSSELLSADGLEAELTRRHAILRAGLADSRRRRARRDPRGVVTYLTGYTTATWSNHSRPIVAVLTPAPSTSSVPRRRPTPFARACRAHVHSYVELRSPDGSSGLPDGAIQFTPHACEVLATVLRSATRKRLGRRARRGAPADVPYRRPSAGTHRRFDASNIWAGAPAQERLGNRADARRVRHPRRAFADLRAALRPG